MIRRVLPLALLGLLAASPAFAGVQPLAGRDDVNSGPVILRDRVVYANREGRRAVRILERPLAGGAPSEVTRVPVPRSRFVESPTWDFAAGPGGYALRVRAAGGARRLWAGPGPLTLVQKRAPQGVPMTGQQDLFAVAGGPLVLERTDRYGEHLRAMLRPPGAQARPAPVPTGADLHHLAVTGSLAAARVGDEIVVFDLPSGAVRRRLPLGGFAGTTLHGLGVSGSGDVALTVEDVTGADFLGWAPAGATQPAVLLDGDHFGLVRTAAGRIAMQQPAMRGEGTRVVVLDPAAGELFHGPPAASIRSIDFDGRYVGWATDACQLISEATPAASADRVPAGPCLRTEVWPGVFNEVLPRGHPPTLPVQIRCLTAPGRRCKVDLRVYTARFERIGRLVTHVPVRSTRLLHVRARRAKFVFVVVRVVDPDGRRRISAIL